MAEKDDNPDIQSYLGRGDLQLRWNLENDKSVTALVRHVLDSGRDFIEFDWTGRKLFGPGRICVQATSGCGESLIDYNFRQNTDRHRLRLQRLVRMTLRAARIRRWRFDNSLAPRPPAAM